jgi:prepilin-type N-terminal cleavage/methylation domain-containing protein
LHHSRVTKKKVQENGFSLIELVIVIAITAILGTIAVPAFNAIQNRAKETALKSSAQALQVGIEAYAMATGRYPATDTAIDALIQDLKANAALDKSIQNPFTGANCTASDSSGKITYSYNNQTNTYTISVYGQGNRTVIETLQN